MTAQRICPPPTAFRLSSGKKRPREQNKEHRKFIGALSCCICGTKRNIEAAHIRMGDLRYGKRETGANEKPSDCWIVPLCDVHHRTGPQAQHEIGESNFWTVHKINPIVLALALWRATGDDAAAELIISELRRAP